MCTKKRIIIYSSILILCLLFLSRYSNHEKLSLRQSNSEIKQIDLGYSPWRENKIIYTLEPAEFDGFLNELHAIRLRKNTSPKGEYGTLYVQITYSDGAVEILGSLSCFYFKEDTKQHDGWYYLLEDDLYTLFAQYINLSSYPI